MEEKLVTIYYDPTRVFVEDVGKSIIGYEDAEKKKPMYAYGFTYGIRITRDSLQKQLESQGIGKDIDWKL
jgi:hypothetical protein